MRQNNTNKILNVFYENPGKKFTIREIMKITKIPRATVHKRLSELKKEKLITKDNMAGDSLLFKTKKVNYFIEEIVKSGVVDAIIKKVSPSCIILFGSMRKGESVKDSDIDLFVATYSKNKIDLSKFEKKLKHKIALFSETKITKLPDNLLNNVVNGIKLHGSFKIK